MSSALSSKSGGFQFNLEESKTEDSDNKENVPLDAHYDPAFVRKTMRRIDWRMLPLLGILYAVALIDRINLAVARTAGMDADLKLFVGERYSIASMIYFVPYTILQLPGNLILRWLGARSWLTICVVGWGVAQTGMAFVPTWGYLALCRVFLGAFEAGFFPSLVFIITTWYKRHEVQVRLALFYISSIICGSFSNILAYGLTHLKGKAGLNGWQWIFLIEGIFTIMLGVPTWLLVTDFPDKASFLTPEEQQMVLDRVEADRGDSIPDEITWAKILKHLCDPILWAFCAMFLAATVPAYASGYFITIMLRAMGYSESLALILTAPPGIFAAISCYVFAKLSDKTRLRAPWLVGQSLMCLVGLAISGFSNHNPVRYFGLFFVHAGGTGAIPAVLAYSSNNITSHSKRAVQTAIVVAAGGIGGIFATTVFRQKDFPRYKNGMGATIGLQGLSILMVGVTTLVFRRRNKLRREGKIGPLEGQPDFYYTL